MNKDVDRAGIVLYETNGTRKLSSASFSGVNTPGDHTGSPAVMHYEQLGQRKFTFPKSMTGTPRRFINDPLAPEAVYPEDEGRFRFLRQTNTQIMIGVFVGTALGAVLSRFGISSDFGTLVSLPGKIFLNVIKALVLPMVFASLSTGVASIVLVGKVSAIGTRTGLYFFFFAALSSAVSLSVALMLRSLHPNVAHKTPTSTQGWVHFQCPDGSYMEMTNSSAINCSATNMTASTLFQMIDITNVILASSSSSSLTISQQIAEILESIFPNNLFASFNSSTLLSIIAFAVVFGAAATKASTHANDSPLVEVLNQINTVLFYIITKVIDYSPLAVASLIAGALGTQSAIATALAHVAIMFLGMIISVLVVELVIYPIAIWLGTRRNPYKYMVQMLPCVTFAFGCASSIATLPVTIRCVESTREVSRGLLHFVLTIGATVHMDGTAMFFPGAIVFLFATAEDDMGDLSALDIFLIWFISFLSSLGSAPIPNGGLVLVYSVWATVFPKTSIPISYSYIVATYWIMDRLNTMCNVVGDTFVARIIAEQVDETYEQGLHQEQ